MRTLEEKKKFMRDYWLDSLTSNQSEVFETEWFGNDEDAELLEVVRGDLIEDYLTNNLNTQELRNFKNHFLINNLQDVALAKSYVELGQKSPVVETAKAGFFETISENWRHLFKIPQIAFAIVLLVGSVFLLMRFADFAPVDVAQNEPPAFDSANKNQAAASPFSDSEMPPGKDDKIPSADTEIKNDRHIAGVKSDKFISVRNKKPDEKISEKAIERPAKPQVLFLTNFRGNVKTLKLSDKSENFSLRLDMPGIDKAYKNYEVRIYDSGNNLVVRQKLQDNLSLTKSGEKIEVKNLSKNKFKRNETYKTSLVGYDEKNNAEELSLYDSFKVESSNQ